MSEVKAWEEFYIANNLTASELWNSKLHAINEFLEGTKNFKFYGKVLEIGAGTGWASATIKALNPSVEMITTEINGGILLKCMDTAKMLRVKIDGYVPCEVTRLPFDDNTFDVVCCNSVLHHIEDLNGGLREINRVLKKDGVFYASGEPSATKLLQGIISITRAQPVYHKLKDRLYSCAEWEKFFNDNGMRVSILVSKNPNHKSRLISKVVAHVSSVIPDKVIKNCLASSVYLIANKV